MKKLRSVLPQPPRHWVGDGFPVRTLFSYHDGRAPSPFLLLDHAGPLKFEPAMQRRGVDFHPHRGFETVTIAYQGEVEHRDSAGNSGKIAPGDVQWMTAGAGVLHEEKHSDEFTYHGGSFEMVQLWVNLPARFKMTPPRYQTLLSRQIPRVRLASDSGDLRVIAGEFDGARGPARTFTPVTLWDLELSAGKSVDLPLADGHSAALLPLDGTAVLEGGAKAGPGRIAVFDTAGAGIQVRAEGELHALVLGGEPIDEPIAGYGPFVMNTEAEIEQAIRDYQEGRFGR
ncbi:MAG TPA: pirin family protein [Myxococcota bacterium]|nr:pirin family protein [Myxococcota bacterium]